jgi:Ca2+-binding EF-hand superfamily protein
LSPNKDEELQSIVEDLDTSGDGFIQFEEFTKFMVSRTQIRDTFDEVLSAFTELAAGKVIIHL